MVEPSRLTELAGSLRVRLQLPEGDLVVALSGGADSAALAWMCAGLGRPSRSLHVNHGLPHSDLMESAARAIAAKVGLEIEVVSVDVAEGASPEGRARDARYTVLEQVEDGAVLTAHTLDDDAETLLLNLVRGAGPRGLGGIPYHRPPSIYRPALDIRRTETRELAHLAGLEFVDDPMNADLTLTRNWIRWSVVPQLEPANPKLMESLHRTARLVRLELGHLEEEAGSISLELAEGVARAPSSVLLTIPRAVAGRAMMRMLENVLGPTAITEGRVSRMWSVLRGESRRQELGGGVVVGLKGPMLVLRLEGRQEQGLDTVLTPGIHRVGRLEYDVRSAREECRVLPLSNWAAVFAADTELVAHPDGVVTADGEQAWIPGEKRFAVAWYRPGETGYLSVRAREGTGWTSSR